MKTLDFGSGQASGKPVPTIRLDSADVHVWSVQLDKSFGQDTLLEFLTLGELASLQHTFGEIELQLQLRMRALLRFILSFYLEVLPAAIPIEFDQAQPRPDGNSDPSLRFSTSVSETEAMFAVAKDRTIGIDVVFQQEVDDSILSAATHLTPREKDLLAFMPPSYRSTLFYRLQSRRNALAKARAAAAEHDLGIVSPMALDHHPFERVSVDGWTAEDIVAPVGYASALVAGRTDWRLQQIRLIAAQ